MQEAHTHNKLPKTYDFGTMYTTIPHDELKSRMHSIIVEAFQWKATELNTTIDQVHLAGGTWNTSAGEQPQQITEWVNFVVDNTFILNGDQLRRQVVGIPMGGGSSQDLADLYCYSVESEWLDQIHNNGANVQPGYTHIHTCRYIDDALTT